MSPKVSGAVRNFLDGRWVGAFGTINKDGSPHMTPIWHEFDGQYFYHTTRRNRVKIKNIMRDNKVTLLVFDPSTERVVIASGQAELTDLNPAEWSKRLAIRYLGKKDGAKYFKNYLMQPDRVILRLKPTEIIVEGI